MEDITDLKSVILWVQVPLSSYLSLTKFKYNNLMPTLINV